MASETESEHRIDESSDPVAETSKKIDSAIKSTAQKYLSMTRAKELETTIRDQPLAAAAIAAVAGFVVGGGMASRPGVLIMALIGRKAARETAASFMGEMLRGRTQPA
jgi:ElaB/YqjD/DUF883 family membrane-anchored ribosome-binding protein